MHHTQIKSAVTRFSADFKTLGESGVKVKILEAGIAEADADTIIEAIKKTETVEPTKENTTIPAPVATSPISKSPNDSIKDKLAAFDYNNLKGESFAKYGELVQSLPINEKFDFQVMQVEAIVKERYKGVKDTPKDIVGIKIVNSTPKYTTRVNSKTAIAQNGRVERDPDGDFFEVIGQQFNQRGNGLFYLLKK